MALMRHHGGGIIVTSFVIAFMLTIVPLPSWLSPLRPEWVAMVLIYWCIALPQRVSVGYGWLDGLFVDVLRGALLCQHALGIEVIAFLAVKLVCCFLVFRLW